MARARNLKPGFFKNEELADGGPYVQLLFAGLWTLADRKGRLEDRPRRIKAEVLPYYEGDIDPFIEKLASAGFILRYERDGNNYIQIINFEKHQTPHFKEADSTIPAPGKTSASPGNSGTSRADSLNPPTDSLNPPTSQQPRASDDALNERFAVFWLSYPNKKSKGKAEKSWKRIKPDEQLHDRILHALERAKKSEQWCKDGGKFIPHPATWLNAKGWEDEHSPQPPAVKKPKEFPKQ